MLADTLGIQAVLSMTERFEVTRRTPLSSPITPEDWRARGIRHEMIETPDLQPVAISALMQAADLINQIRLQNLSFYLHCTAGRGRSISAAVCYFVKYHRMTVDQAIAFIHPRRETWLTRAQMDRLREFERLVH